MPINCQSVASDLDKKSSCKNPEACVYSLNKIWVGVLFVEAILNFVEAILSFVEAILSFVEAILFL